MSVEIRQATLDDAATLARLNVAVHSIHTENRPDIFKPPNVEELTIFMASRLNNPTCVAYIAEVDSVPVGYTINDIVRRDENPFKDAHSYIVVDNISVEPAYRSQGVGEALMERVYALAREQGINRVTLSVWAFNERAIAFYERLGFSPFQINMDKMLE